jgi:hypothetical protein
MSSQVKNEAFFTETLNAREKEVLDATRSLKFGEVRITIHDAKIVQIEKLIKYRF